MKKKVCHIVQLITILLVISVFAVGCGPINFLTKVKKTPKQHSLNYFSEESVVKAKRSDINKKPWIVYSDKKGNIATNRPGGKVKANETEFLEPFLVIKKKGEFLALIKHSEEVLKNGKLNRKAAEFVGWMPKSQLLLENQSYTDVNSNRKRKYITVLTDTLVFSNINKLFVKDSIPTYKDLDYKHKAQSIAFMDIVYPIKEDIQSKKVLITKKPYIEVATSKQDIIGWIDKSLLGYRGQVLNIKAQSVLSLDSINFKEHEVLKSKKKDLVGIESQANSQKSKTVAYNPILSYSTKDSLIGFVSKIGMPVYDNSKNFIYNVLGDKITYPDAFSIDDKSKQMNVVFVFEQGKEVIKQFPQLINALQNLQGFFEEQEDEFNLNFTTYMSFNTNSDQSSDYFNWTKDYSELINYLIDKAESKTPLKISTKSNYTSLHKALESLEGKEGEQNIIVVFGEKGIESESRIKTIEAKINEIQARIFGVQVFAKQDSNESNNFVLNISDFIENYANDALNKKKKILVSPNQVRNENEFVVLGEYKNSYMLDFPNNSITQGGIIFPVKGEVIAMDLIAVAIDTLVKQIKLDRLDVQQQIAKSFRETGNNRTVYSPFYQEYFYRDTTKTIDKSFLQLFSDQKTMWYLETVSLFSTSDFNNKAKYTLLLDKWEYEELKDFVEQLSAREVELKYQAIDKTDNKVFVRDERDLFKEKNNNKKKESQQSRYSNKENDSIYANTSKVRRHLYNQYKSNLVKCTFCKLSRKELRRSSIAQAQYYALGGPTTQEMMNAFSIRDVLKKRRLTDSELDWLITYFKNKKEDLDKVEQFESLGQTYYWVPLELLP